ncbi:MAG: mechanosensitive ion channel [Acidobacteriota bacterium]|nr:mechanosensitive ion channel [Acidobacteriota bacterium]
MNLLGIFLQAPPAEVPSNSLTGIPALDQAAQIIINYAPKVLGAILLLILAWIVANLLRLITRRSLGALGVDEKLSSAGSDAGGKVIKTLSDVVYWIVFLCFIPAILGVLGVTGILAPIQDMLSSVLTFLPSVLGAALIFILGLLVANIVRQLVTSFLTNVGLNGFAERNSVKVDFTEGGLAGLIGTVAYALILLAVLSASLSALGIEAISNPIKGAIDTVVGAIPNIFGATIVLVVAYFFAKVIRNLVRDILIGIGFNKIPAMIGLSNLPSEGDRSASAYIGHLSFIAIIFYAISWASQILGFQALTLAIGVIVAKGAGILTGIVVLAIGMYISNIVAGLISDSGVNGAPILATVARVAILFVVGAMALTHMGVGTTIVQTAFSYMLGAVAIAAAIAFGLGGRDFASKLLAQADATIRDKASDYSPEEDPNPLDI